MFWCFWKQSPVPGQRGHLHKPNTLSDSSSDFATDLIGSELCPAESEHVMVDGCGGGTEPQQMWAKQQQSGGDSNAFPIIVLFETFKEVISFSQSRRLWKLKHTYQCSGQYLQNSSSYISSICRVLCTQHHLNDLSNSLFSIFWHRTVRQPQQQVC